MGGPSPALVPGTTELEHLLQHLGLPSNAARGAEPGLQRGPGERGSSAPTYGMSHTGSLLGNPVREQSPAFLPDGINNHCQWDW